MKVVSFFVNLVSVLRAPKKPFIISTLLLLLLSWTLVNGEESFVGLRLRHSKVSSETRKKICYLAATIAYDVSVEANETRIASLGHIITVYDYVYTLQLCATHDAATCVVISLPFPGCGAICWKDEEWERAFTLKFENDGEKLATLFVLPC